VPIRRVGVLFSLRAVLPRFAATEGGSFFSLDRKETKDQGLELMWDKLVETLLTTAARNEEKSFLPLFWFCELGEGSAQVSTASPSIISYAG